MIKIIDSIKKMAELQTIIIEDITTINYDNEDDLKKIICIKFKKDSIITEHFVDCIKKFVNLKKLVFLHSSLFFESNFQMNKEIESMLNKKTIKRDIKKQCDDVIDIIKKYKEKCVKQNNESRRKFYNEFAKLKIENLKFDFMDYDDLIKFDNLVKLVVTVNPILTFDKPINIFNFLNVSTKLKWLRCTGELINDPYDLNVQQVNDVVKLVKNNKIKLNTICSSDGDSSSRGSRAKLIDKFTRGIIDVRKYIETDNWNALDYTTITGNTDITDYWNFDDEDDVPRSIYSKTFVQIPRLYVDENNDKEIIDYPLFYNYKNTVFLDNELLPKMENRIKEINPDVKTLFFSMLKKNMKIPSTVENIYYINVEDYSNEKKIVNNYKKKFNCNIEQKEFDYKINISNIK